MRRGPAVGFALLLVFAGCLGSVAPGDVVSGREKVIAPCVFSVPFPETGGPPDPDGDVKGWEDGAWHNESIRVDQRDGLTCAELERVLARTMARVEVLRDLEFEETPRMEVISREAFQREQRGGDLPAGHRDVENARFEALFMVNESTDATAVGRQNRGTSVAAYFAPGANTIVFITEDARRAQIHTGILAHELVHALQHQHFDALRGGVGEGTAEDRSSYLGLVEGDANYVEYLHEQRCTTGEWADTCLRPDERPVRARPRAQARLANVGPHLITYHPYSDGPSFVEHARDRGGWTAVNALYRSPPQSTEQVIHPGKYPDDRPVRVDLRDRSTDEWTRVTRLGAPNHETVGEAGLFATFMYPYYHSNRTVELVPAAGFRNEVDGELDALDPFNYSHPYSAGWAGDTLLAYRQADEADSGEYAYTWELAFDSGADAEEFLDGYRRLLDYHGARQERERVWVIPEGREFADAFYVERTGTRVLIVNAPTVDDLAEVRRGVGRKWVERRVGPTGSG